MPERPDGRLVIRVLQDDHSEIYLNDEVALLRQSWTGRRRLLVYALDDAAQTLKAGRNTIAIRCDNTALGECIDVGLYLEPVVPGDGNPVRPVEKR